MEIRLLDATLVQGDFAIQCSGQSKDHPALDLRDDRVRIDGETAIHGERHATYVDIPSGLHFCLNNGGNRCIEGWLDADASADAWRQSLTPVGLFRHKIQHALQARRL